ncbi:MAG: hypothetical protein MPW15_27810 [Candidatus Manganitrophus sp.]|nr:hypothetical protein [Candidatus Manganitrophus sp.]
MAQMETVRTPFPKGGRFGGSMTALGWRKTAEVSATGGRSFQETEAPSRQERIAYGALLLFVALIYITPGNPLSAAGSIADRQRGGGDLFSLSLFRPASEGGLLEALRSGHPLADRLCDLIGGLSIATSLWRIYSLDAFLDVLKLILVYLLVLHLVDRLERVRRLFWVMLWAGMVLAAGTLAHYLLKIDLVEGYRGAWIGGFTPIRTILPIT